MLGLVGCDCRALILPVPGSQSGMDRSMFPAVSAPFGTSACNLANIGSGMTVWSLFFESFLSLGLAVWERVDGDQQGMTMLQQLATRLLAQIPQKEG